MASNETPRRRNTIRLPDFDYTTPGAYFVTVVTEHRIPSLGHLVGDSVELTDIGRTVRDTLLDLPAHNPRVVIDIWTIMPDHVHFILFITPDQRSDSPPDPT